MSTGHHRWVFCAILCWGDQTDPVTIKIDDCHFPITRNLDSALRHLRDPKRVRRMWVDAICINQHDIEEKSVQVEQMWNVFYSARNTLIYLGDATPDSDELMRTLKQPLEDSYLARFHEVVNSLLERDWFSRVWTFQELVFSIDPWIFCGQTCARWTKFTEICKYYGVLKQYPPLDGSSDQSISQLDQICKMRWEVLEGGFDRSSPRLIRMLKLRRGSGVSDARDMIFAHYNAAKPPDQLNGLPGWVLFEKPDYSKTKKEVYEGFAKQYLRSQTIQSLLLEAESKVSFTNRQGNLPSWVPDWMQKRVVYEPNYATVPDIQFPFEINGSNLWGVGNQIGRLRFVSSRFVTVDERLQRSFADKRSHLEAMEVEQARKLNKLPNGSEKAMFGSSTSFQAAVRFIFNFWNECLAPHELPGDMLDTVLGEVGFYRVSTLVLAARELLGHMSPAPQAVCHERRIGLLDNGLVALLPAIAEPKDSVWITGSRTWVLRPSQRDNADDLDFEHRMQKRWGSGSSLVEVCSDKHFLFVGQACIPKIHHQEHDDALRILEQSPLPQIFVLN